MFGSTFAPLVHLSVRDNVLVNSITLEEDGVEILIMEAPLFVKCEPVWPPGREESPNIEQLRFVNYEDMKVEPSTEEETSVFVKEEDLAQDIEKDPGLQDCDNDEQSPNQIQPVLNGADRHDVGNGGGDCYTVMKCEEETLTCISYNKTEEHLSPCREGAAISSPSQSKVSTPISKVKYRNLLSCGKCGKSYSRPGHLVEFKNAGLLYCRQCHKEFAKDSGKKLHPCKHCGKMFSDFYKVRRHEQIHNRVKRIFCTECNKGFLTKESLKSHMNSHTGERPYQCSVCNRVYARVWSLRRHTTTHTGDKPHVCITCGKVFALRSYLIKHAATHTGTRDFSCTVCGKAFAEKYTLKTHMLTHTGERPYSCSVCKITFSSRSTRRRHILIHAKQNP